MHKRVPVLVSALKAPIVVVSVVIVAGAALLSACGADAETTAPSGSTVPTAISSTPTSATPTSADRLASTALSTSADPPASTAIPGSTGRPVSTGRPAASISVEMHGGMCASGEECRSIIEIRGDGSWNMSGVPTRSGTVDVGRVNALVDAIEATDFAAIRSHPFTDICPMAYDGQETVYTFVVAGRSERLASCETDLSGSIPIVDQTDALAEEIARG